MKYGLEQLGPFGQEGGGGGGRGLRNAIVNNFVATFLRKSVRDARITHKLERY